MPQRSQAGARARVRRLDLGRTQAQVAQDLGVSASYLNLIEHGKRRISPMVLDRLAGILCVEKSVLSDDGDPDLVARLSTIAPPGAEPPDALVDRFPIWARAIARQADALHAATQTNAALTERTLHDPALAGALHEVLSTVTSIQSTAAILVGGAGDPEWEARFHKNIYEDSHRLAGLSQALVEYLDGSRGSDAEADPAHVETRPGAPLEYADLVSDASRAACDPMVLARERDVSLMQMMSQLGRLRGPDLPEMGFAACDGAGVVTDYVPCDGFVLAPMRGACPLWPLFQAISQPGRPIRRVMAMPGSHMPRLTCYAVAEIVDRAGYDGPATLQAAMLVVADAPAGTPHSVGPGCATCSAPKCPARREAVQLRL